MKSEQFPELLDLNLVREYLFDTNEDDTITKSVCYNDKNQAILTKTFAHVHQMFLQVVFMTKLKTFLPVATERQV